MHVYVSFLTAAESIRGIKDAPKTWLNSHGASAADVYYKKSMSGPNISNGCKRSMVFFKNYNLILNKLPLMANARSPTEIATLYEK